MRRRVALFWARGLTERWPIDALGYTFLGTAILAIGDHRFGSDWTGREPWEVMIPHFDGRRPYVSDGYDGQYAMNLLSQKRPDSIPAGGRNLIASPLTQDEWREVEILYRKHLAPLRQRAADRMRTVNRILSEELASGRIGAALRMNTGFQDLPAENWLDEGGNELLFLECQANIQRPATVNLPDPFASVLAPFDLPGLMGGNAWLFVRKADLDRFAVRWESKKPRQLKRPAESRINQVYNSFKLAHPDDKLEDWKRWAKDEFGGNLSPTAARSFWQEKAPPGGRIRGPKSTRH